MLTPYELRVCLDIGSQRHRALIGLSDGIILEEWDVLHTAKGIDDLFKRIAHHADYYQLPVAVAMEGYNGHARPLDRKFLAGNYRLLNINNLKLARFKEIFPGVAKSDVIDTRKIFELFTLQETLPLAKNVLQLVCNVPTENEQLKRLTRRRDVLVCEKTRVLSRLQSDLNSIAPGLISMTGHVKNKWFLTFLTARPDFKQLVKMRASSLVKLRGIGKKYIAAIQAWQQQALLSDEVDWVGDRVIRDAKRILELQEEITGIEGKLASLVQESSIAKRLSTIPGFGLISTATLAGEIGTLERFAKESSLALYMGMSPLECSSGKYRSAQCSTHVNSSIRKVFMIAAARHIELVPEAKAYYQKKRGEGKRHNQAVRSLGRHLARVIWSMLRANRDYLHQNNGTSEAKNN